MNVLQVVAILVAHGQGCWSLGNGPVYCPKPSMYAFEQAAQAVDESAAMAECVERFSAGACSDTAAK